MPKPRFQRENDFMRRQTQRRGGTKREVKLTKEGHWQQEYPIPQFVQDNIEPQWKAMGAKNEFS